MESTKLQSVVQRQLPEFIQADYPKFLAFIKAYYEYMDIVDDRNIAQLRDIDETVDSFIDYFKGELGLNVPTMEYMDMRLFLRKSKHAFTSKGTEDSYKLLFRILFNKAVDISYPWDSVLKASDGKWQQDTSIFVEFEPIMTVTASDIVPGIQYTVSIIGDTDWNAVAGTSGITYNVNTTFTAVAAGTGTGFVTTADERQASTAINSFIGNQVTVTSTGKFVKVYVDRVKKVRTRVYELSIDKNYYGDIEISDVVVFGNYTVAICPTTIGYEILNSGKNYKVGDLIVGTTLANGLTIEQVLRVTKVDSIGGILGIVPVRYGCGYTENFYLLTTKQAITTSSNIAISRDSVPVFSTPDSGVDQYLDSGSLMEPTLFDFNSATPTAAYGNPTYAGETLKTFYNETINNQLDMTDMSLIGFTIGAVAKYQGYYIANDGFLSDAIRLQDSKFYQKFSYVLTVNETIDAYRSYIKSFLHSAGLAMYGEYQITDNYDANLTGSFTLGLG